uniref:Vacuolar protein sorting-associated protein 11 homolog n=1 Tax=Hyaloperonospora arabidopsidis (strain Emoy2) TaxID=559515 RepID=M4BQ08_HYAAE
MAQWRRFAFFDKEVLKDANGPWMKGVDITSMSANRGLICVGDADGYVHLANRSLEARKFQAHELFVSHVVMMKRSNVLATIGDGIDPRPDELREQSKAIAEAGRAPNAEEPTGKSTAVVRFWRTDLQDREGKPKLLQQIPIFAKKYPEEAVTAFAVNDDLSQFAVGLKNGAVILFRSDLKRRTDRPSHLLQPAGQYPVTGLSFISKPVTATSVHVFLYASTRRGLTCYHCSHDDPALVKSVGGAAALPPRTTVLDERGVDVNCSCVNEEDEIAVGQTDAVYFYTTEDRSVCFAFEGEKKYLHFFKHYLLVAHIDPRGRHQVNVYDLQNKFIAFNWTLTSTNPKGPMRKPPLASNSRTADARFGLDEMEEVRHVVCEFGAIFVVSSMGHVYRLSEKDTTSKLEILFRKNLYSIAISLAFSSNYDVNSIIDIFRMYGDHLYQKGDYDGSLRQYVRTIGHVEPSYVIRRFLDAQRIHNLTAYLEALHEKAFANAEHTTLLLNCYTKLKDVKKLDKFIQLDEVIDAKKTNGTKIDNDASDLALKDGGGAANLNFDVETAISVLWENYPQHALTLARKHEEHSWYLKIQLGQISYVDSEDSAALSESEKERVADALEYIQHLSFSEADSNLRKYGRTLVTHMPGPATELLKRLCTGKYVPEDPSLKSDPGDFLHLFVSHRAQLKEFLQYIVEVETVSNTSIGNTLLEMVLSDDDEGENGGRSVEEKEESVLRILDNPRVKYDEDHALIHLQMRGMKKGKRYLYNKLHMYHMLVQFHIEENDDQSILEEVRKHGDKDPNLWSLALKYFAERGPLPKGATSGKEWEELQQLLVLIDTNSAIPPLQVVQVLSQSRELPVSVIKQYVVNQLASDEKKIEEDEEKIKAFRSDTKQMKEEIAQLSSRAVVFQATKCDLCSHDLDLPAVHFMCQHSFHLNCISETDRECISCSMDHRHILGLKTQLEQKAGNHEQFYNQLETAADGFNTIAEYFGKGIFKSNEVVLDEGSFETRFSAEF